MEPTQDVYNFAPLIATLDYAYYYHKKVIVRVFFKSYRGDHPKPLPAYILGAPGIYGGASPNGGLRLNQFDGFTPRFDNTELMARFKTLITTMSLAIGNHPALQGIGPDESAWSLTEKSKTWPVDGLKNKDIVDAHRKICAHMKWRFPEKEIYPFVNFYEGGTVCTTQMNLRWFIDRGYEAGITDTHRIPEMLKTVQPIECMFPMATKTLVCVDHMSIGEDDSSLTERFLENARKTAYLGADITAWYADVPSSNYWRAAKNAMSVIG
jgi:hypothetical protein